MQVNPQVNSQVNPQVNTHFNTQASTRANTPFGTPFNAQSNAQPNTQPSVKLCAVIEGVQFVVEDQGIPIRAIIVKEALEDRFGASPLPVDWITCYVQHQQVIDHAALLIHKLKPVRKVVVLRGNEPELIMS